MISQCKSDITLIIICHFNKFAEKNGEKKIGQIGLLNYCEMVFSF